MKTAIAISPMMRNVLSVAKIPPAAVKASQMARITPRIVPMIRPMYPVCARRPWQATVVPDAPVRGRALRGVWHTWPGRRWSQPATPDTWMTAGLPGRPGRAITAPKIAARHIAPADSGQHAARAANDRQGCGTPADGIAGTMAPAQCRGGGQPSVLPARAVRRASRQLTGGRVDHCERSRRFQLARQPWLAAGGGGQLSPGIPYTLVWVAVAGSDRWGAVWAGPGHEGGADGPVRRPGRW